MKKLKNIFIVLMILVISVNAKDNYQIQWEPENPFRFFKDKNIYWEMRKLYKNIKLNDNKYENSKGLAFERALQSNQWRIGKDYPKNGWAAYFGEDWNRKTYWNQNKMLYGNDNNKDCKNYIDPKSHNIKVWVDGTTKRVHYRIQL